MKRILLSLVIAIVFLPSFSQVVDPVSWEYNVKKTGKDTAKLEFLADIEMNWHLYSQNFGEGGPLRTTFHFEESENYELVGETKESPEPEEIFDETFGIKVKQFSDRATFTQKIRLKTEKSFNIEGNIEYQVCQEDKCVYFNPDFNFKIEGEGDVATASEEKKQEASPGIKKSEESMDVSDMVEGEGETGVSTISPDKPQETRSLLGFFIFSILLGLAGILTPCVFPMIPMTVSFFMQGQKSKLNGIIKALIFGISIIVLYTSVGIIVSLTSAGAGFTTALSTHWIPNLIFFVLFITFAASFFGMFEIVLPSGIANKADKQVDKGGFLASFFLALTLVIVSFSCTGPIVGALLVKAAAGDVLQPTIGMFGFAIGFGLPFTILAISPGWLKKMPKSGGWMNSVKVVLAFIILAFSFKFLSNIDQNYHLNFLSRDLYLSIWIALFGLLGLYLIGKIKMPHDSELKNISVVRLVFAIASFTFAVYLLPGLFGANLNSISGLLPPKSAQNFEITATTGGQGSGATTGASATMCEDPKYGDILSLPYGVKGYFEYEQGMECAKELDKPVILYVTGHSCSNCKKMQAEVWSEPEVQQILNNEYVLIALYVDDRKKLPESEWVKSEYDGKVKKTLGTKNADFQISEFNTNTQPFYILLNPQGEKISEPMGYELKPQKFIDFLEKGLDK